MVTALDIYLFFFGKICIFIMDKNVKKHQLLFHSSAK